MHVVRASPTANANESTWLVMGPQLVNIGCSNKIKIRNMAALAEANMCEPVDVFQRDYHDIRQHIKAAIAISRPTQPGGSKLSVLTPH